MKRLSLLMIPLLLLVACSEDDSPVIPPPDPVYKSLANRSDVLNNLELAWNDRNLTRYEQILDSGFTFFLSPGDVGGSIPEQWGRADEILQTSRLFDRNLSDPNFPRVTSLVVDIEFEGAPIQWVEESGPGETWYSAVIFYDFMIHVVPDLTYIPVPGARGRFTVRNAGTEEAPKWQLVEWHDLGGGLLATAATPASTEESTWGKVKSLYR